MSLSLDHALTDRVFPFMLFLLFLKVIVIIVLELICIGECFNFVNKSRVIPLSQCLRQVRALRTVIVPSFLDEENRKAEAFKPVIILTKGVHTHVWSIRHHSLPVSQYVSMNPAREEQEHHRYNIVEDKKE